MHLLRGALRLVWQDSGADATAGAVQMPHDLGALHALNRTAMVATRSVMAEVVRALAVLALVFLSFAGSPAVAAHGDHYTPAGYDFCGTPPGNPVDHAPCHACRASPVVLPTAPAEAGPAFAVVDTCLHVSISNLNVRNWTRTPANPRAPPALV